MPAENGPEAALAAGIDVIPIDSLTQLPALAAGEWEPERPTPLALVLETEGGGPDLADLRGQRHLRHALEVAAAGGHSLLMIGPPGAGKSLAASRLPSILPPPVPAEALEVARIASACGRSSAPAPGGRPFPLAAPHDQPGRPGRRRQPAAPGRGDPRPPRRPLPRRALRVPPRRAGGAAGAARDRRGLDRAARAPGSSLPCRFMLVAAANPCPCGRGEADPDCSCAPLAIQRYQGRLSGALADRIDILAAIRQPSAAEIGGAPGEPSAAVRERVEAARERQGARLGPGPLQRRDDPGRGSRVRSQRRRGDALWPSSTRAAAQRPRPRPGAAAGADDRRPRRER